MKRIWEVCPRDGTSARWAISCVSMNPKGEIRLNRYAHKAVGEPEACKLLFDRQNSTIGILGVPPGNKDAYPLRKKGPEGAFWIRAYRLCQEFGVRFPETIRFKNPEIDEEGVMILDLRNTMPVAKRKAETRQ